MAPVVEQVEQELGVEIEKLEVWYNEENAAFMYQFADSISADCGGRVGVPAFYNMNTGEAACGEISAGALKDFIMRGS